MLLDTIPQIINNIKIPEKSNFEIYAPYVAVFVSLLTVVVNIWLNNKQIKNSHSILEKTIEANWKNNLKNVTLNHKFSLLNRFNQVKSELQGLLSNLLFEDISCEDQELLTQRFYELESELRNIAGNLKITAFRNVTLNRILLELSVKIEGNIDKTEKTFTLFNQYLDYNRITNTIYQEESEKLFEIEK